MGVLSQEEHLREMSEGNGYNNQMEVSAEVHPQGKYYILHMCTHLYQCL
jgi:hypothetical protein